MHWVERFRMFILGNPIRNNEDASVPSMLVNQLLCNIRFDLFFCVILLIAGACVTLFWMRKARASSTFLMYIAGALIIFSALNYKYISRILGNDIRLHNEILASRIRDTIDRGRYYVMGLLSIFFSPITFFQTRGCTNDDIDRMAYESDQYGTRVDMHCRAASAATGYDEPGRTGMGGLPAAGGISSIMSGLHAAWDHARQFSSSRLNLHGVRTNGAVDLAAMAKHDERLSSDRSGPAHARSGKKEHAANKHVQNALRSKLTSTDYEFRSDSGVRLNQHGVHTNRTIGAEDLAAMTKYDERLNTERPRPAYVRSSKKAYILNKYVRKAMRAELTDAAHEGQSDANKKHGEDPKDARKKGSRTAKEGDSSLEAAGEYINFMINNVMTDNSKNRHGLSGDAEKMEDGAETGKRHDGIAKAPAGSKPSKKAHNKHTKKEADAENKDSSQGPIRKSKNSDGTMKDKKASSNIVMQKTQEHATGPVKATDGPVGSPAKKDTAAAGGPDQTKCIHGGLLNTDIGLGDTSALCGVDDNGSEPRDDDAYIRDVLRIFNDEFSQNGQSIAYFQEMNRQMAGAKEGIRVFNKRFKRFYSASMSMEQEMASFNATPKYFQYEAQEMVNNAMGVMALVPVLDSLNTGRKADASLNGIFTDKATPKTFENLDAIKSPKCLSLIMICICLQVFIGIGLLVALLCGAEFAYLLKLAALVFLVLNIVFGVYMMLLAQLMARRCILGNIGGCRGSYTESFMKFAATTNLDLNATDHGTSIESTLGRIELRTRKIVDTLRTFLETDPGARFENKALVIQSLFNKIEFVREDFDRLTNCKTSKEEFYMDVDIMNNAVEHIRGSLRTVNRKTIVDFYTREVVFLNFIEREKTRISREVQRQTSGLQQSTAAAKNCKEKQRRMCDLKNLADRMYAFMIIGSIALAFLLIL